MLATSLALMGARDLSYTNNQHDRIHNSLVQTYLLILTGVREAGNNRSDRARGGGAASVNHDQQFHQAVIDLAWCSRLDDID